MVRTYCFSDVCCYPSSFFVHTSRKRFFFLEPGVDSIQTVPVHNGHLVWLYIGCAPARQTRYIEPMLVQCWHDYGPTLKQYWINVSCFLGGGAICQISPPWLQRFFVPLKPRPIIWATPLPPTRKHAHRPQQPPPPPIPKII